jgi:hypothetical protein
LVHTDDGQTTVIVLGRAGRAATYHRRGRGRAALLAVGSVAALVVALAVGYWLGLRSSAAAMEPAQRVQVAGEPGEPAARTGPSARKAQPVALAPPTEPQPAPHAEDAQPDVQQQPATQQPPSPATPGEPLRVLVPGADEPVDLRPLTSDGAPREPDYGALRELFTCKSMDEAPVSIEPALVQALISAQQHFERPLQILGGRCSAHPDGHDSAAHHRGGRAVDVRFRGVPTGRLAPWLQEQSLGGVGRYKKKGIVHLDVRPGTPVHWEPEAQGEGEG